jgi:excisionase family DNA binding protein
MASIQRSNRRRLTADWTPDAPLLLTKRQAALLLNVSERTIGNLLASKQLVRRRIGSRCLITRSSVESFVKRDHPTQVVAEEAKEGGSK